MTSRIEKSFKVKIGSREVEFVNYLAFSLDEYLQVISGFILYLAAFQIMLFPLTVLLLGYLFFYTKWSILISTYIVWFYYDKETPFKGGRSVSWYRKLSIHRFTRDYFPVNLIKTAELPPGKNYLLVAYPHGIIPTGVFLSFATEANKVESEVFPGFDVRLVTANLIYNVPVCREHHLALGCSAATEANITCLLESDSPKCVVLVAGGFKEFVLAYPGSTYKIISSIRKGFVRIALKTGASLVPVFSFGQNNSYELGEVKWKWLSYLFDKIYEIFGVKIVNVKGRGIFQNSFGILPRSGVVNVVVGKPIPLPKVDIPSKELIDEYHRKFFEALETLFEENKHKYDVAGNEAKLIML